MAIDTTLPLFKPFDWRRINAANKDEEPADDYCKRLREFLLEGKEDREIQNVRRMHKTPFIKDQMESMLLTGMSEDECAEKFGIDRTSVRLYKKLFFDIDLKKSEVERASAVDGARTLKERSVKSIAVRFGKDPLLFFLGHKVKVKAHTIEELKTRLEFALLARCAEIETINPNSEKATKFVINAINTYIKLESIKKDTTSDEVQSALKRIMDLLGNESKKTKRSREDIGL